MQSKRKSLMILAAIVCSAFIAPCYGKTGGKILEGDIKAIDTLSYSLGVTHAVAIKADSVFSLLDFNVSKLNDGIKDVLTDVVKMSSVECKMLEDSLSAKIEHRKAEFDKRVAETPTPNSKFKPFENDEERDSFSYLFGNVFGAELKNAVIRDNEVLHYYWYCKAFEDVYADTLMLSGGQMLAFLKRYTAKSPTAEMEKAAETAVVVESVKSQE